MDQSQNLRSFVVHIMNLQPPARDIYGGGISGLLGSAEAIADTIANLHRHTLAFADALRQGSSGGTVVSTGQEIEGLLQVLRTFGVLSEAQTQDYVSQLHGLIDARKVK
jgi:hypothetical protein